MSDYRNLTTGDLKRLIAERRGYEVLFFHERTDWHEDGWVLYRDGQAVDIHKVYTDEQSAWADVPDWPMDMNGASELLLEMPEVSLRWNNIWEQWFAWRYIPHDKDNATQGEFAVTPALTVCYAWLKYHSTPDGVP